MRNSWIVCKKTKKVPRGFLGTWNAYSGLACFVNDAHCDSFLYYTACLKKNWPCVSCFVIYTVFWLVVSTPLKNLSQLGWLFSIYGKIENVPNHQPVFNVTKIIQWGLSNNGVSQIPCFFVTVIPFPFTCNLEVYSTGIARLYTQFSVTPIHIFGLVISYKAGGHNLFSQKN